MLKHFYKTFLISFLSGSLLSINPSIVLAASKTSTDKNGVTTAKQSHKFEPVTDKDMIASLAMLSTGFITARMAAVYNKPLTIDAMIAAAAGVAFIAGEITSNVKFKNKIKEMTVEVEIKNDGTVNEEQIKRLEDLKKSYEEAKKTTKFKKILQLASAAGFAAASGTAGYLNFLEYSSVKKCMAAVTSIQAVCPDSATYLKNMAKVNKERKHPKPSNLSQTVSLLKSPPLSVPIRCVPKTPADAAAAAAAATTANAACAPTIVMLKKNQVFTYLDVAKMTSIVNETPNKILFANSSEIKTDFFKSNQYTSFEKFLNLFISKADAGWLPLLGLGGGVAAAFAVGTTAVAKQIDLWIYVPFNRSIIFGVQAGVAYMASKSSDNTMNKIDENIKKIDDILASLNSMSKGIKAQNIEQQRIGTTSLSGAGSEGASFSTNNDVKTPCMTANNSENCEKLGDKLSSMPGFSNIPDSFKDIANQVVSLGDNLSGTTGISGSTLSSAEKLGNKQNAIARLAKNTKMKISTLSNGELNTDKETDLFNKSMAATLKKGLEKTGFTATGLMASISATPIDSAAKNEDDSKKLAIGKPFSGNAINLQSGAESDSDSEMLKLDFKEESPDMSLSLGDVSTSGKAAPEYEMDSTEINGDNGPTIFELISGRYFKSGYSKLLEEEPIKN